MDWKGTVTSMTDKVFPGLSNKINCKFFENEVTSSLPLQMTLYFNVVFVPFWLATMLLFLCEKYVCFDELYKFIILTVLFLILTVELLRLYLGYEGNLGDKIPELAGFWMLSLLLQLPLQTFLLLNPRFQFRIVEMMMQFVMCMLIATQIVSGYFALKHTSTQQATYFRIMKLKSDASIAKFYDKYKIT